MLKKNHMPLVRRIPQYRISRLKLPKYHKKIVQYCNAANPNVPLLYYYDVTKTFWEAFCSWLGGCKINSHPFTIVEIFFGLFDAEEDWIMLNDLILKANIIVN